MQNQLTTIIDNGRIVGPMFGPRDVDDETERGSTDRGVIVPFLIAAVAGLSVVLGAVLAGVNLTDFA